MVLAKNLIFGNMAVLGTICGRASIICTFLLVLPCFKGHCDENATKYNRVITSSQLFKEILETDGDKYSLSNAIIKPDSFLFADTLVIDKIILIRHCRYDGTGLLNINNVHFKKSVVFFGVEDLGIFFRNCQFDALVRWDFSNTPNAVFRECKFAYYFNFFNTSGALQFDRCQFTHSVDKPDDYFEQLRVDPWNKSVNKVTIRGTNFRSIGDTQRILFSSNINELVMEDCHFASQVQFFDCSINQKLQARNCLFDRTIWFNNTIFPEIETSFEFSQLAGFKISLFNTATRKVYKAQTSFELADSNLHLFNELTSVYSKLYNSYKARGDRTSANSCYVEMKDLETRRLKYITANGGDVNDKLNYQLNRFLKFFAEYGTNPVRSIQISIYVILLFALAYFFVYSNWDRIDRSFLVKKYQRFRAYLTSKKGFTDFYDEDHKDDISAFKEFKASMDEYKGRIPWFYHILGKPLYFSLHLTYRLKSWMYGKTELIKGEWNGLSKRKRVVSSAIIAFSVTSYLIYLFTVRAVNSIILSVNTFSTLGFGDIPVTGISRYLAILEGFLGWFLLSIFSVSLISQILQG